ncbi:MAG: F0F1 ATP synthase subunit delta [Candidatus Moraniibacteriota bacterium]
MTELSSETTPAAASIIARNFFGFLKRRGEEKKMNAILKQLEKMDAVQDGRVAVTVVLAHVADADTKARLSSQASKLFPHKKVEIQYVMDPGVIGGAVFRTDEVLYDATLAAELNSLKKSLVQ